MSFHVELDAAQRNELALQIYLMATMRFFTDHGRYPSGRELVPYLSPPDEPTEETEVYLAGLFERAKDIPSETIEHVYDFFCALFEPEIEKRKKRFNELVRLHPEGMEK